MAWPCAPAAGWRPGNWAIPEAPGPLFRKPDDEPPSLPSEIWIRPGDGTPDPAVEPPAILSGENDCGRLTMDGRCGTEMRSEPEARAGGETLSEEGIRGENDGRFTGAETLFEGTNAAAEGLSGILGSDGAAAGPLEMDGGGEPAVGRP